MPMGCDDVSIRGREKRFGDVGVAPKTRVSMEFYDLFIGGKQRRFEDVDLGQRQWVSVGFDGLYRRGHGRACGDVEVGEVKGLSRVYGVINVLKYQDLQIQSLLSRIHSIALLADELHGIKVVTCMWPL